MTAKRANLLAVHRRIFSDQLTPVLAYRRLVSEDEREAPSFLLESVVGGERQGRYSFLGAHPALEIIAREHEVTIHDHRGARGKTKTTTTREDDPLEVVRRMGAQWRVETNHRLKAGSAHRLKARSIGGMALPDAFTGGWVGYAGYDTVRYLESGKLPFAAAPRDDRDLPDLHLGLYREVAVFDHVAKVVHVIAWVSVDEHASERAAEKAGHDRLEGIVTHLQTPSVALPAGEVELASGADGKGLRAHTKSNMTRGQFEGAVRQAKEYIKAGDIFQVVLSQRFARESTADPFEVYRALRIVNPSPYMIYLQARGSILVASSPEILCRVHDGTIVNRPLAGTRGRGATDEEDAALASELLADEKERAEHVMLVDLGRNDVGRVAKAGSVTIERKMEVERYSHVMHLSSTVTGELDRGRDCWDALRASLPAGTISGAPKVRAMQVIDELEQTRRGPYGGGIGVVSFTGNMDMALALRTIVVPTTGPEKSPRKRPKPRKRRKWSYHVQAGAGIVADSVPANEYQETVNKAAALDAAIDLAEKAFARGVKS